MPTACHAWVRLRVGGARIQLDVSDDGVGSEHARAIGSDHYGVKGMRERVAALGGTPTAGVRPWGGALVRARLPVEQTVDRYSATATDVRIPTRD